MKSITIDIITLFPEMFESLELGVCQRAFEQHIDLRLWNPRDFTANTHRSVDDRPYGGGPGMVMCYEPLLKTLQAIRAKQDQHKPLYYLSPQGVTLNQSKLKELSDQPGFILLAGRYEGIDQRFIDQHVDGEISIGDYVLSGGELAALVILDGLARLLPGVLGHPDSSVEESFDDNLLDHPQYTRPEQFEGKNVPKILLSGDHQAISRWRLQQSLGKTWQKRPDLLKRRAKNALEEELLQNFIAEQDSSNT